LNANKAWVCSYAARRAVRGQIGRAGDEDAPGLGDSHGVQGTVGQVGDPHGDIHALIHNPRHAIGEHQTDVQPGMASQQVRDDRQDVHAPEHDRRCHDQGPTRLGIFSPQRTGSVVEFGERVTAALAVGGTLRRERDGTGGPAEQRDAKLALERGDGAAGRRRRDAQIPCRGREAEPIGNGEKGAKAVEAIHDCCASRKADVPR
jgi:hypothetical protein